MVCPIHLSHLDPPLMGAFFPRAVNFMAKKELFFFPLGPLIKSLGSYPVGRGETDSSAIRSTIDILKQGKVVVMFPEGTRGDGVTLGKINAGMAMLAKRSGAFVLPVGVSGTQKALPKGRLLPKRTKICVVYAEPFTYDEVSTGAGNEKEARARFHQTLVERLAGACAEAGLPVKTE